MDDTFSFCLDDLTIEQANKIIKCIKEIIPGYTGFNNIYTFNDIIYNYLSNNKEIPKEIQTLVDFEMLEQNELEIVESRDRDKNDKRHSRKILKNIKKYK